MFCPWPFVFELLCQRQKADTIVYLCFLPFSFVSENMYERVDKNELIRN